MKLLAALLLASLSACASTDANDQIPSISQEDVEALGVVNGRAPFPGVVIGGQLTESQMEGLAARGFDEFVSLRPAGEGDAGWEEAWVAGRDMRFHRIAVAGAAGVTRENAERLAGIVDGAAGHGVVVYCKSGNRAGALFALKAALLEGRGAEEALQIGRDAGMTSLEPHVAALLQP
jgi:uncharacterized protein (TIGR01244 family)